MSCSVCLSTNKRSRIKRNIPPLNAFLVAMQLNVSDFFGGVGQLPIAATAYCVAVPAQMQAEFLIPFLFI